MHWIDKNPVSATYPKVSLPEQAEKESRGSHGNDC